MAAEPSRWGSSCPGPKSRNSLQVGSWGSSGPEGWNSSPPVGELALPGSADWRCFRCGFLPRCLIMTLTDMNKWTSGETEAFFDPRQTLSVAGDDANLGEGTLPAHPSALKFVHFAIAPGERPDRRLSWSNPSRLSRLRSTYTGQADPILPGQLFSMTVCN
jgi:hypothetical protein